VAGVSPAFPSKAVEGRPLLRPIISRGITPDQTREDFRIAHIRPSSCKFERFHFFAWVREASNHSAWARRFFTRAVSIT
jgi:hypothetical protein